MKKDAVISDIMLCPLFRACRVNNCILRQIQMFGYVVDPSLETERDKNKNVERAFGKGYVPAFRTRFREGKVQVICPDFTEQ